MSDAGISELLRQTSRAILAVRDEASAARLARLLVRRWHEADQADRLAYLRFLATELDPEPDVVRAAMVRYDAEPTGSTAAALADASEAPRQELFRRLNIAPGGTSTIVAIRSELLRRRDELDGFGPIDHDLAHLLRSWFNLGFLRFEQLTWDSPTSVLEKLIEYEAVHEVQGWDDLRRRLQGDRRCFALFHPALPGEPIIFVAVALTVGLAASVEDLLAPSEDRPVDPDADTAIFYSITNCQEGLRGISFGSFLLKQVIEQLSAELPQITRFSTLSPIPGLRRWLRDHDELADVAGPEPDVVAVEARRDELVAAAADYLTSCGDDGRPLDPVGRFHLRNGARVERINWMANSTAVGLDRSLGMMVNYLYDPAELEANHEALVNAATIAASPEVLALRNR
ncbi:MAG: malonyl-CoA decarboxylase family protein [Actinomycetota bacterium]